MKTIIYKTIMIAVSFALFSCSGEDRTYEYLELTQHNNWIYEQMQDVYLWADSLKEPKPKEYFGNPKDFLKVVTSPVKSDKWSVVAVDTLQEDPYARGEYNHIDSYGIDYVLVKDPTNQTSKEYIRVLNVYPNSPAERCGLERGDFIITFDGYKFSSSNMGRMKQGEAHRLKVCHLIVDEEEEVFSWKDTVEYDLPASEYVEDVAFPKGSVFVTDDKRIAYLMCTRLTECAYEKKDRFVMDEKYRRMLDSYMAGFKNAGVTDIVLDLRLCNYGSMEMARSLASYIVSQNCLEREFVKTKYNDKRKVENSSINFDRSVANLGVDKIVVLTSSYTKGAAEWLIHSLSSLMGKDKLIVVGSKTAGQNVMTEEYANPEFYVKLHPAVAYVADANDDYNYGSGIVPDYLINEEDYVLLYSYGDINEVLLSRALEVITLPTAF